MGKGKRLEELLEIKGVEDLVIEVIKLRTERDSYKEKYNNLVKALMSNTVIDSFYKERLRVKDEEFNYILKYMLPEEFNKRISELKEVADE